MTKIKQIRLSRDERTDQLLDVTQSLILEYGLNSFTIQNLAMAAGVSKPLVYQHFDTRLELLQALLLREYQQFYKRLMWELRRVDSFEETMVILVNLDFDQLSTSGNILLALQSQADVNVIIEPLKARGEVGKFLVARVMEKYSVSAKQAKMMAKMASGSSNFAAQHYTLNGGNRKKLVAEALQYILGGLDTFKKV